MEEGGEATNGENAGRVEGDGSEGGDGGHGLNNGSVGTCVWWMGALLLPGFGDDTDNISHVVD